MTAPTAHTISDLRVGLNSFDWVLVGIFAGSTLLAFFHGLIREIFALCGAVAGLGLAVWKYGSVAPFLSGWIRSTSAADLCAFCLIAFGVMIASALLGRLVQGTAHTLGLGFVDRLAGAGFGAVRGALLGMGLLMVITAFLPRESFVRDSRLAPYFLGAVREVSFVVPQDLQKRITGGIDSIRRLAQR